MLVLCQNSTCFSFAVLMVLTYCVANSPAEITRLTVIVRIGTAAGSNAEPLSGLWKKYGNEEQTMFEYRCSRCGWVIKSPVIFQEKKPCLNCDDGFVELQTAEHSDECISKKYRPIRRAVDRAYCHCKTAIVSNGICSLCGHEYKSHGH